MKKRRSDKLHGSLGGHSSWHQRLECEHSTVTCSCFPATTAVPHKCIAFSSPGSFPVYLESHFQKGSTHVHLDKSPRVFLYPGWGSRTGRTPGGWLWHCIIPQVSIPLEFTATPVCNQRLKHAGNLLWRVLRMLRWRGIWGAAWKRKMAVWGGWRRKRGNGGG